MKNEIKQQWVDALRSGEYRQGHLALRDIGVNGNPDSYCCLGVLCDLAEKSGVVNKSADTTGLYYKYGTESEEFQGAYLPESVRKWAGIEENNPKVSHRNIFQTLAGLNDSGYGFKEIATIIEDSL